MQNRPSAKVRLYLAHVAAHPACGMPIPTRPRRCSRWWPMERSFTSTAAAACKGGSRRCDKNRKDRAGCCSTSGRCLAIDGIGTSVAFLARSATAQVRVDRARRGAPAFATPHERAHGRSARSRRRRRRPWQNAGRVPQTPLCGAVNPAYHPARLRRDVLIPDLKSVSLPSRIPFFCATSGLYRRYWSGQRGERQTQRMTASAVSLGLVLKHSFACGAFACTTLISFSKSRKLLGMTRMPAPMSTQS